MRGKPNTHKQIAQAVRRNAEKAATGTQIFLGVFVAPDDIDPLLSTVFMEGNTLTGVPKTGSSVLVEGDFVILMKGRGTPMMIIDSLVGYTETTE